MEVDSLKVMSGYSAAEQGTGYTAQSAQVKNTGDESKIRTVKKPDEKNEPDKAKATGESERYAIDREQEVSEGFISDAIKKANSKLAGSSRRLSFSIHEKTNKVMVKVIDSTTQEVIREIPPESTLNMLAKVLEMAGLMVDEKR